MMNSTFHYKALEMHTHTRHSDGCFSVPQLCRAAKADQFDGIALTDHNTQSGCQELTPQLEAETLPVVHGIEWTTYFGHMLVLGADRYVDWRFALPDDIDAHIAEIQSVNGVVGIAHPYAIGSPMCTGCHWMFMVDHWENVDYIEVWHEPFPANNYINNLAFEMWTSLLNRGFHLAATEGRDWHCPSLEPVHFVATYIGVEDGVINTLTVREAIRAGRTFVSGGPTMDVLLTAADGTAYGLGQTAPAGACSVRVAVDETVRRSAWEAFGLKTKSIRLVHRGETVARFDCDGPTTHVFALDLASGWIRVELYGDYLGEADKLLAFSSPIYLQTAMPDIF